MNKEIRHLISQLKKGEICIEDIPSTYRNDVNLVVAERKLGLRKLSRCGYDVIHDRFFVEEDVLSGDKESDWSDIDPIYFDDFESYFSFMDGNIYDNACYYQLNEKKLPEGIDKNRLYEKVSFIEHTISDYTIFPTDNEKAQYNEIEKRKTQIMKWLEKFNKCTSFQQLEKVVRSYSRSALSTSVDVAFFIWHFIFQDLNDESRFKIIMEYMSTGAFHSISRALCAIYNPDDVIENYKYALGSYETRRKHIQTMKQIAKDIKEKRYKFIRQGFFDSATHFYYLETKALDQSYELQAFSYRQYFDDVNSLITFLNGDLRNCDFSNAQNVQVDFSEYVVDDTTKLPISETEEYDYSVEKAYRDDEFMVTQMWKSRNGSIVKKYEHRFDYFFDFIAFLEGDLTNADLVSCNGLNHINPTEQINLRGALITSKISEKWGIPYNHFEVNAPSDAFFDLALKNETETAQVLHSSRELTLSDVDSELMSFNLWDLDTKRIYYISDIHLCHLLENKKAKSKPDVTKIIRDVVSTIIFESCQGDIILINGDTSLDFSLFKLFVTELAYYAKEIKTTVIFTIGNHDLWSCPDDTIDQLSEKYRVFLKSNDMYLLQNDVLFFNDFEQPPERITEQEINDLSEEKMKDRVKLARLIFFGGTGFSGYNQFFNAEVGLYRWNNTIGLSRDLELKETKRFEDLYKKIVTAFRGKNTVIMTHMPLPDWYGPAWEYRSEDYSKDERGEHEYRSDHPEDNVGTYSVYQPGFIYVSGHTHRNYFYDDGSIRIYADNQFGYNKKNPNAWPHLKYFEVDKAIDLFADYNDGIYEITADEYRSFYRCKNIRMDFNRETNIIYMLKKSGHYCFIHQGKNKTLSIMNGGNLRRLDNKDISYYFDNMDAVISIIKDPLDKYTALQRTISEEVKRLGGYGSIHGCIVDIDFYNHIYVNPTDGTVTGYWAGNIINKLVYPTIPALLEAQCPKLFAMYKKILSGEMAKKLPVLSGQGKRKPAKRPVLYLDTDIYQASRQIKKMQKLNKNILSTWPDTLPKQKLIKG